MRVRPILLVIILSSFAAGQRNAIEPTQRERCIQSLSGYESTSKPEPAIPSDLSGTKIIYSESGCYGKCPAYSLKLKQGEVVFHGHNYTRKKGNLRAKLKPGEFEEIVKAWFENKFYAMRPDYCRPKCPDGTLVIVTDVPEYSVGFRSSELTSNVSTCSAYIDGKSQTPVPPESFFKFQKMMRALAKAHGWL